MCLRFPTAIIMGTVLTVSSLAHAKTSDNSKPASPNSSSSSSSSTELAQVQAIISYCESVDPQSVVKYRKLQSLLLSGNSGGDKSAAYRSESNAINVSLSAIPVSTGVAACRSAITGM